MHLLFDNHEWRWMSLRLNQDQRLECGIEHILVSDGVVFGWCTSDDVM